MMKKFLFFCLVWFTLNQAQSQNFSLSFDGVDDYFKIMNYPAMNLGTSDFTIEAWIKLRNNGNSYYTILTNRDSINNGFVFRVDSIGRLNLTLASGSYTSYDAQLDDDNCHHVTVIRRGFYISLIIDGILNITYTTTVIDNITTTHNYRVGNEIINIPMAAFSGELDELRLWRTSRSVAAIAADMDRCLSGTENNLIGNWRFDQDPGNIIADISTNMHHGEILNMQHHFLIAPEWIKQTCGPFCEPFRFPEIHDPNCILPNNCHELICNGGFEQGIPTS